MENKYYVGFETREREREGADLLVIEERITLPRRKFLPWENQLCELPAIESRIGVLQMLYATCGVVVSAMSSFDAIKHL